MAGCGCLQPQAKLMSSHRGCFSSQEADGAFGKGRVLVKKIGWQPEGREGGLRSRQASR